MYQLRVQLFFIHNFAQRNLDYVLINNANYAIANILMYLGLYQVFKLLHTEQLVQPMFIISILGAYNLIIRLSVILAI